MIAEIDEEFSEKAAAIAEITGQSTHDVYKDLLTGKFIDNNLMTPKYLFRATRANSNRKVSHNMKLMETIKFQSLLHYDDTSIFKLDPIDIVAIGVESPKEVADPRGVARAFSDNNAHTELKEWFNESVNRAKDLCMAAIKITPLIGKTIE